MLGKIVGVFGVQGALKVHPFADDPKAWSRLPGWWIGQEEQAPQQWQHVSLGKCTLRETGVIVQFKHIKDRTQAETLIGKLVGVPKDHLPPTQTGEYYWTDLIGLEVFNKEGQLLGQVLGLIETATNDVLRIGNPATGVTKNEPERLLPFIGKFVLEVDLQAKRILVDWQLDW